MDTHVILPLAKEWIKKLTVLSLWFFGVFVLVYLVLTFVVVVITGEKVEVDLNFLNSWIAPAIFMLVLGIVRPLIDIKHYLLLGVPRKLLFYGMLLGTACVSFFIALAQMIIMSFISSFSFSFAPFAALPLPDLALQLFLGFVVLLSFYLAGWAVSIGINYGTPVPIAISILFALAATNSITLFAPLEWVNSIQGGLLPLPFAVFAVTLVCLLCVFLLASATKKMPVKAS